VTSRVSLLREGLQSLDDGLVYRVHGLALLDLLVEAVLDEDLDQSPGVELVLQLALTQLELGLEPFPEAHGVVLQDLRDGHIHRLIVDDDDGAGGDRGLAIGEGVEGVDRLLWLGAGGEYQLDLHALCGEVVDAADGDLLLLDGGFDGADQRLGVGARGNFLDDQAALGGLLDARAQLYFADAIFVLSDINQAALLVVGEDLEGLLAQDGDLGFDQLAEIMGQDARGESDGNAFGPQHQQHR